MKLAFTTACFYPTTEPIGMLMVSAERQGIELHPYGVGKVAGGWGDIKVTHLLPVLRSFLDQGYTHALYTDGRDSLFARNKAAILNEYILLGLPPCVMSAEVNCYPLQALGNDFPDPGTPWRYPCAGQFMGEIPWILEHWQMLQREYEPILEGNDQAWISQAIVDGKMDGLELDTGCRIFQSMNGPELKWRDHAWNPLTNSSPCVLHFNGGYVDPVTGRDDKMKPIWEKIRSY